MRAAGSGIPGRSVDDVRQHDEWYSEYLILKDSKKKAIQEWKDDKEVELFLNVNNSLKFCIRLGEGLLLRKDSNKLTCTLGLQCMESTRPSYIASASSLHLLQILHAYVPCCFFW